MNCNFSLGHFHYCPHQKIARGGYRRPFFRATEKVFTEICRFAFDEKR